VHNLHLAVRFAGFASLSTLKLVLPNFIILGIVDLHLFEDELAEDELLGAAMFFSLLITDVIALIDH